MHSYIWLTQRLYVYTNFQYPKTYSHKQCQKQCHSHKSESKLEYPIFTLPDWDTSQVFYCVKVSKKIQLTWILRLEPVGFCLVFKESHFSNSLLTDVWHTISPYNSLQMHQNTEVMVQGRVVLHKSYNHGFLTIKAMPARPPQDSQSHFLRRNYLSGIQDQGKGSK